MGIHTTPPSNSARTRGSCATIRANVVSEPTRTHQAGGRHSHRSRIPAEQIGHCLSQIRAPHLVAAQGGTDQTAL
jgi:hypothetical protein